MQLHLPPSEDPRRDPRHRPVPTISPIRSLTGLPRGAVTDRLLVTAWARAHGRELLFVDANHFLLEVTARAFRGVGASCHTATTQADAIRLVELEPALRAAIVDFEIPDGGVGELVRRLRGIRPAIRLIGTSGRDRRREFARLEVDRFVLKPWRFADLVEAASG